VGWTGKDHVLPQAREIDGRGDHPLMGYHLNRLTNNAILVPAFESYFLR
jgi:hypothetical protein